MLDEIRVKPSRDMLFYVLVQLLLYHASTFFIVDTGSGMFFLLLILPLMTAVIAVIYGYRHGIHVLYPLITALLFLTVVWLHFNESACIYLVIYGMIALVAMVLGKILKNVMRMTKKED
jgi:hypothetical protein